jgi:hypothetical protein
MYQYYASHCDTQTGVECRRKLEPHLKTLLFNYLRKYYVKLYVQFLRVNSHFSYNGMPYLTNGFEMFPEVLLAWNFEKKEANCNFVALQCRLIKSVILLMTL